MDDTLTTCNECNGATGFFEHPMESGAFINCTKCKGSGIMAIEDDSQGWNDYEAARLKEKTEKSIIRRFSVFLLKRGITKEAIGIDETYKYRGSMIRRKTKVLTIFGRKTTWLHSFEGPAIIDHGDASCSHHFSEFYYVYGFKCTKAEWEIKLKKHKIEMIRKGK
jgi:hypothetical protein